jgi:hypothetical protein
MTQNHQIAILLPILTGSLAILCTILVHALALMASLKLFRRDRKLGLAGAGFLPDLGLVVLTISFALIAHLAEIALWAALFVMFGEFQSLAIAYYHSAVNYTTLGYGDLIMSPSWKLLGPLEAADGALMFGVSTAMIFAIAQRLVHARFSDLDV